MSRLSDYTQLLSYAKEHRFTVGAFNSFNMESIKAVASAASEKDVPVIVQTYHCDLEFAGPDFMVGLAEAAVKNFGAKLALGLDHGESFEQAQRCIAAGYSGVMIDLSSQDYDRNVYETKRVVEYAHARGVSVEAEIGEIRTGDATPESIASGYTDPDYAVNFVKATGVDCLAVSIGTAHGMYTFTPKINFDLLKQLVKDVPCPIVVHGGSNTPDDEVVEMVRIGMAKLNIGTDLFNGYKRGLREGLEEYGMRGAVKDIMALGQLRLKEVALHKIDLLTTFRV